MSLKDSAMLVSIHAPGFTNNRKDSTATNQTLAANNAASDAGVFVKHLLPKEAYSRYNNAIMAARLDLYRYSSPWLDNGGTRIMASAVYWEFTAKMQDHRIAIETARDEFLANYDSYVADQSRLGGLYNPADFPSRESLARKFDFSVRTWPVADSDDWRLAVDPSQEQALREQVESQIKSALEQTNRSNWARIDKALRELADRLGSYAGTRKGAFRDTVLDEIRELSDLLPRMNLAGDDNLVEVVSQINRTILTQSPETLRSDDTARADVLAECDAMLRNMAGYMGGDDD